MEASIGGSDIFLRISLYCGILSAVIFAGTDIAAGLLTPGYRFSSQSASLLSAVHSKTRRFALPFINISCVLLLVFSIGLWASSNQDWVWRTISGLLAVNAIASIIAFSFYPFHPEKPLKSPENKINIILMGIGVLAFFLAICFGAAGNKNWFRYFSIGLILVFFIEDVLATRGMKPSAGGNQGPLVGVQERTMIYGNNLWLAIQAIILLQMQQ